MEKWIQGKAVKLRKWTGRHYSLMLEAPIEPFIAGQFTRLALDIDDQRIARPYSFVNAPGETPLEFYFITIPDGPLTSHLIELKNGDPVWIAPKASGFFILREVPDGDNLWLLSTGTAIGPFLSILKTPEAWQRFSNIVLVHAVRTAEELTYRDEIRKFEKSYPGRMHTVAFVSREDTDFALSGRIPQAIGDGRLQQRTGISLDPAHSQIMICGNPAMVHDTTLALENEGFKKNRRREPGQITTEKYW